MKVFLIRTIPVIVAGGLWLAGNSWIAGGGASPALAQESQRWQLCEPDPTQKAHILSNCQMGQGGCTGGCTGTLETTSSCQPSDTRNGVINCSNSVGDGWLQNYVSGCEEGTLSSHDPTGGGETGVLCLCQTASSVGDLMPVPGDGCGYFAKGNIEPILKPIWELQNAARRPQLAMAENVSVKVQS